MKYQLLIGILLSVLKVSSLSAQEFVKDYTNAILWQQQSGEYRALCFQAYNIAKWRLTEIVKEETGKPKCIVVDIDETLLDNAPQSAHNLLSGKSFDLADWKAWTSLAVADTVPGACSFLREAAKKGVEVFYVSNRDLSEVKATVKNLAHYGFPCLDEEHLLFRDNTSDKEPRRQQIALSHHISLLVGDNLSDFSNIFYKEEKPAKEGVEHLSALFGLQYILLPNPMYGDWEQSLYPKKENLTEEEKAHVRRDSLISY